MRLWSASVRMQLGALGGAYGALVSGYVILHYLIGERWSMMGLLNDGAHWLTLGAVGVIPLVLLAPRYRWVWLVYTLPAALAFLFWYGPLFVPSPQPDYDHQLTVLTWNIAWLNPPNAQNQATATLNEADADIIGLQEYKPHRFVESVFAAYPYRAYAPDLAIWSKHPILDFETLDTEVMRAISLKATVDVNGLVVTVYVFHPDRARIDFRSLSYDDSALRNTVAILMHDIQQATTPVIVLCDCNFADRSPHYQSFKEELRDSWYEQGVGFGLTAPFNRRLWPIVRSDYVWHSDDFGSLEVEVVPNSISDHLPVRAVLGFDTP